MIEKTWNFYVKKMQKFIIVLIGVLLPVICFNGCTEKEESFLLLELGGDNTEAGQQKGEEAAVLDGTLEGTGDEISDGTATEEPEQEKPEQEELPGLIYVHVCGAVEVPGVYELEAGSRVYEAVEAAGGFTETADDGYVNQAQLLEDGVKLVIPTLQETEALLNAESMAGTYGVLAESKNPEGSSATDQNAGLVNLNTASREELMSLPGIGETRADAILKYRTGIGVFTSKEQIMEIDGIKSGLYTKLQDKICVE